MDALIEDKKSLLQRFILWREKRIKEKHFILILSFLVGIFTALAAWFLKGIMPFDTALTPRNSIKNLCHTMTDIILHNMTYDKR